jgi:glycosyltransferase involved in cell wall biosynthesis
MLTSHTIVKNEQAWIKPALLSVLDQVDRMLVWDTGSTDKTVEIIKAINSPKIEFKQCGPVDRKRLVELRNEQIKATTTDWFLLVDGDEIWPKQNLVQLIKSLDAAKDDTVALVNRSRNAVGDIHHYLPESEGHYQIGPWQGHLNIRAIRNIPGLTVTGEYPLEAYTIGGVKLQDMPERLEFVDTWYLHLTHLKRSDWRHSAKVIDRLKKFKLAKKGIELKTEELPEVLR